MLLLKSKWASNPNSQPSTQKAGAISTYNHRSMAYVPDLHLIINATFTAQGTYCGETGVDRDFFISRVLTCVG